jgi:hypothetical protein
MSGEAVYQTLRLLVEQWDALPVRAYQSGQWQTLRLSEIEDTAEVARNVLKFIASRHIHSDTEAPLPDAFDQGEAP